MDIKINRKRILLFAGVCLLAACSQLDDIKLNDNPYDSAYEGPKVVQIDSVVTSGFGTSKTNKVYLTATINMYDHFSLYKDGTKILTLDKNTTSTPQFEFALHYPATVGTTYTYQVQLVYNGSTTSLSDAVSYTTP
jgi:hypothetical protein